MTASAVRQRFDVKAIKRSHPLEGVVVSYGIPLRRSGDRSVGFCPFHSDAHHPSFTVYPSSDPADDSFYCFGCKKVGDQISFVERMEGLEFHEACLRLDAKPPMEVDRQLAAPAPTHRWEQLDDHNQRVMNLTAEVYRGMLWRSPEALEYVRDRGIPDWVIRACGVGFADGKTLEQVLRKHRSLGAGLELGLVSRSKTSYQVREFLRDRIVVPEVRDGNFIWFIGRLFAETPEGQAFPPPKFLALRGERPILGLSRAVGHREALLCEGVFDYLTAVGWELPVFSPCGTNLPADRLDFLAGAEVVYGVFDADTAGAEASDRFAELLGDRWQPIQLPEGCDLNDLGRRPGGRAEFFRLLDAARRKCRDRGDPDAPQH